MTKMGIGGEIPRRGWWEPRNHRVFNAGAEAQWLVSRREKIRRTFNTTLTNGCRRTKSFQD
jgi:hypothetical protein